MSAITLRFVTCSDFASGIIRRGEMGFWVSHVEALTPDGKLLGAHDDGGVQARAADYDAGQWTLELFVDLPATDDQAAAFYAFLNAQIGKPYDKAAIAAMGEGELSGMACAPGNDDAAFICSALIVAGLMAAGLVKSAPSSVRLTTPRDVLQMAGALFAIGEPRPPKPSAFAREAFDPFTG